MRAKNPIYIVAWPKTFILPAYTADLRALERQVVHEPLGVEDNADDRAGDVFGIDRSAGADGDDRDRAIDADLPTVGAPEVRERAGRHEHDDDGARLRAELKAERCRDRVVISRRAAADAKRALAVFTADSHP